MNHSLLNYHLKPFNIKSSDNNTIVLIDEEFGYRNWIWEAKMSPQQLKRWWKRQKNLGKFYLNILYLHGNLINCTNQEYKFNIWNKLKSTKLFYYSHLFDDEISFLDVGNNLDIHHAGYYPAKMQTERYLEELLKEIK